MSRLIYFSLRRRSKCFGHLNKLRRAADAIHAAAMGRRNRWRASMPMRRDDRNFDSAAYGDCPDFDKFTRRMPRRLYKRRNTRMKI